MSLSLGIIVMGVSGCGKSTVGQLLSDYFHVPFIEGDDYHPGANKSRMAAGLPLTDRDRMPWLLEVGAALDLAIRENGLGIASCSSLKKGYRTVLRDSIEAPVLFVYLHADYRILEDRLKERKNHFMPTKLLRSQFHILEAPDETENCLSVCSEKSPENIVQEIANAVAQRRTEV